MNRLIYMKYSIKSSLWGKSTFELKRNAEGRYNFYAEGKLIGDILESAVPRYSNGFDIEHSIYEKEGEVSAQ